METRQYRQLYLAQNFLRSSRLVRRLVGMSSIALCDTVCEIGAGTGIITAELARAAGRVIAIERDARLVRRLRERFGGRANVEIVEKDFLDYFFAQARMKHVVEPSLTVGLLTPRSEHVVEPSRTVGLLTPRSEYKIFANIPYNMTAAIVRKILHVHPLPIEAYLIMQKEAARKFSGCPRETLFSILAKPFFEFRILYELRRTDFCPAPNVDSVLLSINRRPAPLVQMTEERPYREFVEYGFSRWKPNLKLAYKHVFSYKQWKRLAHDLSFPLNARPTELSFAQWLGLYRGFKRLGLDRVSKEACRVRRS